MVLLDLQGILDGESLGEITNFSNQIEGHEKYLFDR